MRVEVFNVGQGDAFLLKPHNNCMWSGDNFLVDTGPQNAKVAVRLTKSDYHVLLTHSHHDHIGGFPRLYRDKQINSLTIPYYLPEIIQISRFLKKMVINNYGSLDWGEIRKIQKLRLVSDGDSLCKHIHILNPPKSPDHYFSAHMEGEDVDLQSALRLLNENGFELPNNEITNYESPVLDNESPVNEEYRLLARAFVHKFFISLSIRVTRNPPESAAYYADTHLGLTANQASIVFKYNSYNVGDWLFTGDADQSVFNRLIQNNYDISAKFLKVPHHGSRENLSGHILDHIKPQVAVVSHNNRLFGRSKDSHPHHEIIDLLDTNRVRTHYTNNVIKKGKTIKSSSTGLVENGVIEFK